jgi:fructokinase
MYDVVALGELLIDFYENGKSAQGNGTFEACPGGAPCNVLAMLQKLGRKTAFIGKLGDDLFGHRLLETIGGLGIETRGVVFDPEVRTTLAFVGTDSAGERSFAFYRNPGADMMLGWDEVDQTLIRDARLFHFGTLSTTHQAAREATYAAVSSAMENCCLLSFDPNLRPRLWDDLAEAKTQMIWGCGKCDVLKISDDEAEFLTGERDAETAAKDIKRRFPNIRLLFLTSGWQGSAVLYDGLYVSAPAFTAAETIDTTGAGDTFCACVIDSVLREGLDGYDEEKLYQTLRIANAAAAIVTTRKGALLAMPERNEIERYLYESRTDR